MSYVSEIKTAAPETFKTPQQEKTYRALAELHIPFERVDTSEAVTMEDCAAIDERLCMKTVKTLFLCNRQQTAWYLFVTPGDKPFRSKDFSAALGVSRVSFAPAEKLESMLGTVVGSATVFSALTDTENRVQFVLDKAVLDDPWYGCSDGTTTGYMKLPTERVVREFLPYAHHEATVIEV
jgi:Ala-tRNA(Pro) deacylase